MEDCVHAGIDAAIFDRGVIWHVGVPLLRVVPDKAVRLAR
jgi:hypothetical protein